MARKVRRLKVGVTLTIVLSLAIVLLFPPSLVTGITCGIGTGGIPPSSYDPSAVPQPVAEDADKLASELFGDCQEKCDDFVNQLLAVYVEAKSKDFIMVFNPGGWGWNLLEASPEWWSIFSGIQAQLESLTYTSLWLDYLRTTNGWQYRLDELLEMIAGYPSKAKDLACQVEFLTSHIPNLKVILGGESNGTIICDRVMNILEDNPQVYSIQTGPPFWHENITLDRTLVLTSNGIIPDSFSQGDFFTIICTNLEALCGFSQPEGNTGKILLHIGSPGHEYWWQYPGVGPQITSFLDKNFGTKR